MNDKQQKTISKFLSLVLRHSPETIGLRLDLTPQQPPEVLYHGTTEKFLQSIQEGGLQKMSRQHVHLSRDRETAHKVGSRHGSPAILTIRSGQMYDNGILFYLSDNGVWLTDNVPVQYIDF